jgi:hypothetical protein
MIIIFREHVNDSLKTHLFKTAREFVAERSEKILRDYAWQQQN